MSAWWTQQDAAWLGAGLGMAGGLFGTIVGVATPLMVTRRVPAAIRTAFFAMWYGAVVAGAALLIAGVFAGWAGQPWHVRFPLTLGGTILFPLAAGLLTLPWMFEALRRAHREDPDRAAEARGMMAFQMWVHSSPSAWRVMIEQWGPGGRCRRWLMLVLGVVVLAGAVLAYQDFTLASPVGGTPGAARFFSSGAFQSLMGAFTIMLILLVVSAQVKRLRTRLEERRLAAAELRRGG